MFNELFEQHRHWLKEDQLLIVEGKVAHDEFSGSLRVSAEKLFDLQTARNRYARSIRHHLQRRVLRRRSCAKCWRRIASGKCPVQVVYPSKGATCEIDLGDEWRVNLHDDLIQSLSAWAKPENVDIVYEGRAG